MGRRNRRETRRLFAPRRGDGTLRFANVFSSDYRPLTIIEPTSRPDWSAPLIIVGVLIVLGAALIFVFAQ
jgi:hypothetical protein